MEKAVFLKAMQFATGLILTIVKARTVQRMWNTLVVMKSVGVDLLTVQVVVVVLVVVQVVTTDDQEIGIAPIVVHWSLHLRQNVSNVENLRAALDQVVTETVIMIAVDRRIMTVEGMIADRLIATVSVMMIAATITVMIVLWIVVLTIAMIGTCNGAGMIISQMVKAGTADGMTAGLTIQTVQGMDAGMTLKMWTISLIELMTALIVLVDVVMAMMMVA